MTQKKLTTIEIINKAFNNPTVITRAQLAELVDAGDFKWPYWITDHKHGYATARGTFNMPTPQPLTVRVKKAKPAAEAPAPTEPVAMRYFVTDPKGATLAIKGEFLSPSAALDAFAVQRKTAKKSFAWATLESVSPEVTSAS
jgi:hypothetical protein